MSNRFDDIRPYRDEEIGAAMQRISESSLFPILASYVFPDRTIDQVREMVRSIGNIHDFQRKVMYEANLRIIRNSISEFTCSGIENLEVGKSYLFLSNHRDIMLDASLLQNVLVDNGFETSEITFGANLMQGELVIDVGKSNKMFRVERPGGSRREFYKASKHLSEYIRHTLKDKNESVWIAQRNGRTKDGNDRTDQGIINMFRMGGPADKVQSIAELNIVPVAVSYEWEPCDKLKAAELYASMDGAYVKRDGEDLNSVLTGILQPKGRVHFHICKPLEADDIKQYEGLLSNDFNKQIASAVDMRICSTYRLWPNNYIAYDMLEGLDTHMDKYTEEEKVKFQTHIGGVEGKTREILLGIYANPVKSFDNIGK